MVVLYFLDLFFFFFKQKTAYEMRISDWSSDVCSSDLVGRLLQLHREAGVEDVGAGHALMEETRLGPDMLGDVGQESDDVVLHLRLDSVDAVYQIGRASCRERVCQYV